MTGACTLFAAGLVLRTAVAADHTITFGAECAAAFDKQYGHVPDYHNADASAACLAFQYAIEKAGSLNPEKVRSALAALDVSTFYGVLTFDRRGLNMYKPMVVNQIQHGRLVIVWPTGVADAKPQYPAPVWAQR